MIFLLAGAYLIGVLQRFPIVSTAEKITGKNENPIFGENKKKKKPMNQKMEGKIGNPRKNMENSFVKRDGKKHMASKGRRKNFYCFYMEKLVP